MNRILLILLGLFAPTVFAAGAAAQDKPKKADAERATASTQPADRPTSKSHPNDPMLWDAEQMMDEAVMQISRRYSLTPQQEEYTRLLLKKRVREFLDQYESEVRELLQDSIDMKLGRKGNDPKSMMKWASRAMPIYSAAKSAILDGNHEWGVILDEKQKELHEKDLNLMATNFENVTTTLRNWEEGKSAIRTAQGKPGDRGTVGPGAPIIQAELEDNWIAYVERFINAYKLDDAKRIAARDKIHKDQLDKAKQYREANKDKFTELNQERSKIGSDVPLDQRMTKIREIDRRRKDLEKPLQSLFVEMTRRLETLPSSKQRADISDADKKALDDLYRRLSGEVTKRTLVERPSEKPVEAADDDKPKPDTSAVVSTQPVTKPVAAPQTQPVTP